MKELNKEIQNIKIGLFGPNMQVSLTNDGPVTFVLERDFSLPRKQNVGSVS